MSVIEGKWPDKAKIELKQKLNSLKTYFTKLTNIIEMLDSGEIEAISGVATDDASHDGNVVPTAALTFLMDDRTIMALAEGDITDRYLEGMERYIKHLRQGLKEKQELEV